MKQLLLVFCFGVSYGAGSILDIFITDSAANVGLQPSDFNVSASRHDSFKLRNLYTGPLCILTALPSLKPFEPPGTRDLRVVVYFTGTGLKSVPQQPRFQPLFELLLSSPKLSGLAYPGGGSNFLELHRAVIEDLITSSNIHLIDFIRGSEYGDISFLYVAPKQLFDLHHFRALQLAGRFQVSAFSIDPVWTNDPSLPAVKESLSGFQAVEDRGKVVVHSEPSPVLVPYVP